MPGSVQAAAESSASEAGSRYRYKKIVAQACRTAKNGVETISESVVGSRISPTVIPHIAGRLLRKVRKREKYPMM